MTGTAKPFQDATSTPSGFVVHLATAVNPPWTAMTGVGLGEGAIYQHLLIEKDGVPIQRFELRRSRRSESWFRADAIYWREQVVVGFAERIYFVRPSGAETRCVELQEYFSKFRIGDDWLLVASGKDISRLDDCGNVVWRSEPLGIDGVVIDTIVDGVISGNGEWDPPGGWKHFVISLADGARVG